MTVLSRLGEFISTCRYEDIPGDVVEIIRKSILDIIGCTVAAADQPSIKTLEKFLYSTEEGKGSSTVITGKQQVSLFGAALLNASRADALEYADVNKEVGGHPGAMVVPAALVMAEHLCSSGKELITAVALGYEAHRVTVPLYPEGFRKGLHLCMIGGTFGSAAAAGKLLGLNPLELTNALGNCAVAPVAPFEPCRVGGHVKDLYTGWAARTGIFAALLAKNSFSGTSSLVDGELGLLKALGALRPAEDSLWGLGSEWVTRATCIKPHASCRFTHSSADAALELVKKYLIDPEKILSVEVTTDTVPFQLNRGPRPKDTIAARFSIPYVVATVLTKKRPIRPMDITVEKISDESILNLSDKVKVHLDKKLDDDYAEPPLGKGYRTSIIELSLIDGRKLVQRVDYPKGDPLNPVTWEEVVDKFLQITKGYIDDSNAHDIVDMIYNLESLENCCALLKKLRGGYNEAASGPNNRM